MSGRVYDYFAVWWASFPGAPELAPEHRFAPPRRWRFDFAHPGAKVAIELEGGTFSGGRHTRGKGYAADCEKYNIAASLGWRVFRFTPQMLMREPERWRAMVARAIEENRDDNR